MNKTKDAILKTIVYADVFDYPLSSEEIHQFLIADKPSTARINANDKRINTNKIFYFLKGRKEIVALRKKREKWSREKLERAKRAASFLKLIPWVKMVGVTGSLAMKNTDKEDDIDFLIIAATHRLWLTRLLTTMIIEFLGKRRHPLDKENGDKICLNMYLDDAHLAVPKKEQDLFTAHEVVQVKLLWERGEIYNKFLTENLWVKKYLPNAVSFQRPLPFRLKASERGGLMKIVAEFIFGFIEGMVKAFQLWYMKSRRTTEIISDGIIRFHPQDARKWVLEKYNQKSKQLSIAS